jgi:hypothetical protein
LEIFSNEKVSRLGLLQFGILRDMWFSKRLRRIGVSQDSFDSLAKLRRAEAWEFQHAAIYRQSRQHLLIVVTETEADPPAT